jgi:hypothetical protein
VIAGDLAIGPGALHRNGTSALWAQEYASQACASDDNLPITPERKAS